MRRVLRWIVAIPLALVALLGAALGAWHLFDETPRPAAAGETDTQFDLSRLLVLVDGDMTATAYVDGNLAPIEGLQDAIVEVTDPGSAVHTRTSIPASNTVMGWPGAMTADTAGRFAYVIEGRAQLDRSLETLENVFRDMPNGRLLTVVDLASADVVETVEVCVRPNSIDISPSGDWLLIACGDPENELAVVVLADGAVDEVRRFDLDLPDIAQRPIDGGLTYGMIHPAGSAAGIIQSNLGVALVRFDRDGDGIPSAATAESPITVEEAWLSIGRWTRSGGHFLVADTGWGPRPIDGLFNGPGAIVSIALDPAGGERGEVSRAVVSKSPEAFELNRPGDLLAAVNMERAYLPPGGALSLAPGQNASSLSLVAIDDRTGELETLTDPVGFRGMLPEDAAFDRDGDHLAVVIYQDHDDLRSDGWVEFFGIERHDGGVEIVPTGRRLPMPRGAHDLFAVD